MEAPENNFFIKRWRCFPLWLTYINEKRSLHVFLLKKCFKWNEPHIEITLMGALMPYGSKIKIIPRGFIPLGVGFRVAFQLISLDWLRFEFGLA